MKLLKVFCIVIAAHALGFAIIMNPGCRSSSRPEPVSTAPGTPMDAPVQPAYSSELNPATAPAVPVSSTEPEVAPATAVSDAPPIITLNLNLGRPTPTRPGTPEAEELKPPSTYVVQPGDSIAKIAKKTGVSQVELIRENNISDPSRLSVGQKLTIPRAQKTAATAAAAEETAGMEPALYTVKSGDTLSKVAARHAVSTAALRKINSLSSDVLRIGQVLKIPGASTSSTGASTPMQKTLPAETTAPIATKQSATTAATEHTVQSGETLGGIARRYKVSVAEISKVNAITDPAKLRIGQKLVIPGVSGAAKSSAPAPQQQPSRSIVPESPAQPVPAPLTPAFPAPSTTAPIDAPVIPIEDAGSMPTSAVHSAAPLID